MCVICDGMSRQDLLIRRAAIIATHGWAIQLVEPDRGGWPWAYTIGLTAGFDHPELVVVGLSPADSGGLLNHLGERVRSGAVLEAGEASRCACGGPMELIEVDLRQIEAGLLDGWIEYYDFIGRFPEMPIPLQVIPACAGIDDEGDAPRLDVTGRLLAAPRPNRTARRASARKGRRK